MPHLRFRAVEKQTVQTLSETLVETLQPLMECPREDFTFEYIESTFFGEGKPSLAYPFVEVLWFDRGQKTQDAAAKIITQHVRGLVGSDIDVAVIFSALNTNAYYDNGDHY